MIETNSDDTTLPGPKIPTSLRAAATLLRGMFLCVLALMTLRVTMPESSLAHMPRGAISFAWPWAWPFACGWRSSFSKCLKTANGYRVWLYIGLVAVPFAEICLRGDLVSASYAVAARPCRLVNSGSSGIRSPNQAGFEADGGSRTTFALCSFRQSSTRMCIQLVS